MDPSLARADAPALLSVDLAALRRNYRYLDTKAETAECAAVVKADAYGLGLAEVVGALANEGCGTFFVATLDEARQARAVAPDAVLYVLNGLFPGAAGGFDEIAARPVLGSLAELRDWVVYCMRRELRLPAALHIDTGMNRLGLASGDLEALTRDMDLLEAMELSLIMSHLACADTPGDLMNWRQRDAFDKVRSKLPPAPASLANSGGILLDASYHYDMVRAGIALYGARAQEAGENPMEGVFALYGRIVQVRDMAPGESVGYGAAQTLTRPTRVAAISTGYADGYVRLLGASDKAPGLNVYFGDHAAPLLGRVSMDLITVDASAVPENLVVRGAFAELIGPHVPVDVLARRARTIDNEILTGLGRRAQRIYRDA